MGTILLLVGCGDASEDETASAGAPAKNPEDALVKEFLGPDGVGFGREATPSERRQASKVVEDWMQARSERDWAEVCANLHPGSARAIARDASQVTGKKKNCPAAHAYFGESGLGDLTNIMKSPVGSLRISEGRGDAYFHGPGGSDYSVGMRRDNGKWKVTLIAPIEVGQ